MMSHFSLLACDYDGTLATDGVVLPGTRDALRAILSSSRKLVLATGRQLPELTDIFDAIPLFAWVIAENGAVVYQPSTGKTEVLGDPPPASFLQVLHERGISPVSVGSAIVATSSKHAKALTALIQSLGLSHQVILNKDSAMVLPKGVKKGSGLSWVLNKLGMSTAQVVGVGDGENDLDLFEASGLRIAVANAVPELREMADWITPGAEGAGIEELADLLLFGRDAAIDFSKLALRSTEL
jgi:hydroxymethylpyrimidine pyrophosphatase-like HAD family hydrolase